LPFPRERDDQEEEAAFIETGRAGLKRFQSVGCPGGGVDGITGHLTMVARTWHESEAQESKEAVERLPLPDKCRRTPLLPVADTEINK
jgi:hypothetical protein